MEKSSERQDTSTQTPIEVLLQVEADGTVSAKKVYEFLELSPQHYSRWCDKKILENEFAEENIDFTRSPLMVNGNLTNDYKLSISFAKKLCMQQKNERGELARNYFIKIEDTLKKAVQSQLQLAQPYDTTKAFSVGEVTNFLKTTVSVMKHQNSPRHKIAEQYKLTCEQFGIQTISDFIEPPFEQLSLVADASR